MISTMANVIFDFDGTLADSFKITVEVLGELMHRPIPDDKEIERLRSQSLRAVLRELKISWWRALLLIKKARKLYIEHLDEIQPHPGIVEVIKKLNGQGHVLYIISSNTVPVIRYFLHANKIEQYFKRIYGSVGLFSKARILRRVIKSNKIRLDTCYYIGDEGRDIEASYDAGVKCLAVVWGFSNGEFLRSLKPYALIQEPENIITAIKT